MGRKPAEEIPEILGTCDAAFLSFKADPLFYKTIPAKLQSYMACGMPIIAAAEGETRRIIEEAGCGVCSEIGDKLILLKGIKKLVEKQDELEMYQKNSRNYCQAKFCKKDLIDFIDLFFAGKLR